MEQKFEKPRDATVMEEGGEVREIDPMTASRKAPETNSAAGFGFI
jgi:hypothetical protein